MKLKLMTILFFSIGSSLNCLIAGENIIYVDEHGVASQVDGDGMITRTRVFDGNAEYLKLQQILENNRARAERNKANQNQKKTEVAPKIPQFRLTKINPLLDENLQNSQREAQVNNTPPEIYNLDDLRLKDDYQDWYYTGLSIDGGGIRGLIPASILEKVEEHLPKSLGIAEMFDAIGGISIGGILALGLTVPVAQNSSRPKYSATEMVDIFKKRGKEIFPISSWGKGIQTAKRLLFTCGYPAEPLENLLQEYFGNAHLSGAITHVLVGAVENNSKDTQRDLYETYFFESFKAQNNPWEDYFTWQVGRSTSAAPSYFPHYAIRPDFDIGEGISSAELVPENYKLLMMDGGLDINNPAEKIIEYIERIVKKNVGVSNRTSLLGRTLLFSLGTGRTNLGTWEDMPSNSGALRTAPAAIFASMRSRSHGTHRVCYNKLGDNYYRLNPAIDRVIDLADTSEETLDILEKSTDCYQEVCELMAQKLLINKDNRNSLDLASF